MPDDFIRDYPQIVNERLSHMVLLSLFSLLEETERQKVVDSSLIFCTQNFRQ